MSEAYYLFKYLVFQTFGLFIAIGIGGFFVYTILRKLHSRWMAWLLLGVFSGIFLFLYVPLGLPHWGQYPVFMRTYGPAEGPQLSFTNVMTFLFRLNKFERVADIARDPADVPAAINRTASAMVDVALEVKEVIAETAPGVVVNYWTFNGTVPGPMLRVRVGDSVRLTLSNNPENIHHHSIDLHATTGPGGGAVLTNVAPGESKTMEFKALNPGLFVYHCAHPNVATHMAHGMYGLILVEPEGGLPKVDREFYVMQGELYTKGELGNKGLQVFDAEKMIDGHAEYVVFNGRVQGVHKRMTANVGETVRMFVGNGGVNYISSFHVIGEIFDRVYPEAALGSAPITNVQTTIVPAGGATITEFGLQVPGDYLLVDHALARLDRGAWGSLHVEGQAQPGVFEGKMDPEGMRGH